MGELEPTLSNSRIFKGIRMKYNWHEQWVFPKDSLNSITKNKFLGWTFEERDDYYNWHEGEHDNR